MKTTSQIHGSGEVFTTVLRKNVVLQHVTSEIEQDICILLIFRPIVPANQCVSHNIAEMAPYRTCGIVGNETVQVNCACMSFQVASQL